MKKFYKYHNKKTEVDGIIFDSKKESQRYIALKQLEGHGLISHLQLQRRFEVVPKAGNNTRARYYIADFVYHDCQTDADIIEDVKSPITRKDAVYSLKKALMLYLYPNYVFKEYV